MKMGLTDGVHLKGLWGARRRVDTQLDPLVAALGAVLLDHILRCNVRSETDGNSRMRVRTVWNVLLHPRLVRERVRHGVGGFAHRGVSGKGHQNGGGE